jgi:hypothetical protein
MQQTVEPPICLDEEELNDVLVFLDDLRTSGAINMFGAVPYIEAYCKEAGYKINRAEARQVLVYWIKTFEERHPEG